MSAAIRSPGRPAAGAALKDAQQRLSRLLIAERCDMQAIIEAAELVLRAERRAAPIESPHSEIGAITAMLSQLADETGNYGVRCAARAILQQPPAGRPPKDDAERLRQVEWLLSTGRAKSAHQARTMVARATMEHGTSEHALIERLRRKGKMASEQKIIPRKSF